MGGPEITSVNCNNCGAPLGVSDQTRFVTCAHCGAQLKVQRTASAAYTEVLGEIAERTRDMAEDLETIRVQNELERLDREWDRHREGLMVRDKRGNISRPSAGGSMIGATVAAIFGVFWMMVAAKAGAPGFFVLFGVLFVGLAIAGGISSVSKAGQYEEAERQYRAERERLLGDIRARQDTGGRSSR